MANGLEYITHVAGQLTPIPPCYASEQARFNAYVANLVSYFPSGTTALNSGSDVPGVNDRDRPWERSFTNGAQDATYLWWPATSQWITRMPFLIGDVKMFDNATGSGAGWVYLVGIDGRSPMGTTQTAAKSIPSDAPLNRTIAFQQALGAGTHASTESETAIHNHEIVISGGNQIWVAPSVGQEAGDIVNSSYSFGSQPVPLDLSGSIQNAGGGIAHNNLHPVYGIAFYKFDPATWNVQNPSPTENLLLVIDGLAYKPHTTPWA